MEPLTRFGRVSAPWFQAQVSGLWSAQSAAFSWSGRLRLSATSVAFHRPLSPRGPCPRPNLRHCFRSLKRRCRPAACSVCTPPLSRIGPSQSPLVFSPGPSRVPYAALSHCAHPTLIGGAFPRERLPISVARALTSRFSGPRGPCGDFRAAPPAACSGLHATPAVLAQQSFLTPNRGQDPDDPRRSRVFESPER